MKIEYNKNKKLVMKFLKSFKGYNMIVEAFDLQKMYDKQNIIPIIQEYAQDIVDTYFDRSDIIPSDMQRDKNKVVFWFAKQFKAGLLSMHQRDYDKEYKNNPDSFNTKETKEQLEYTKGKIKNPESPNFKILSDNGCADLEFFRQTHLTELMGIFDYFLSPIRNQHETINLVTTTFDEMNVIQLNWHDSLKASGKIYNQTGNILKEYSDGYYWIDLETNYCPEEAVAMGHCGRTSANTVLSLRRKSDGGFIEPFVTIAANYNNSGDTMFDSVQQIKGKNNTKPVEKYHNYILDILSNPKMGFLVFKNEYKIENDFHIADVKDKRKVIDFLKKNKKLFSSLSDYTRLYTNGILSKDELKANLPIIKKYNDGYFWIDVGTNNSNIYDMNYWLFESIESIIQSEKGVINAKIKWGLGKEVIAIQEQGFMRCKPDSKYHPYILDLLTDKEVNIKAYTSHVEPSASFAITDLKESQIQQYMNHPVFNKISNTIDLYKAGYLTDNEANERYIPIQFYIRNKKVYHVVNNIDEIKSLFDTKLLQLNLSIKDKGLLKAIAGQLSKTFYIDVLYAKDVDKNTDAIFYIEIADNCSIYGGITSYCEDYLPCISSKLITRSFVDSYYRENPY
jgi:hypothetical protein